jgi:hypothetical protein
MMYTHVSSQCCTRMYRLNVVHACIVSHLYTQVLRMYCLAPALAPAVGTSLPVCGSLCARATAREPAWREQRRVYERRGALKTQGTRRGAAARRAEQTMEMAYAADGMRAYWSAEVQLANIKYMQLPDVPCPAPCCHKPPLASTQGARYKAPVTRRPLQGARYKAPVTRRPVQGARYKAPVTRRPLQGARYKAPVTRRPLQGARYKAPVTRRPLQGARYKAPVTRLQRSPSMEHRGHYLGLSAPFNTAPAPLRHPARAPLPPGPRPSATRPAPLRHPARAPPPPGPRPSATRPAPLHHPARAPPSPGPRPSTTRPAPLHHPARAPLHHPARAPYQPATLVSTGTGVAFWRARGRLVLRVTYPVRVLCGRPLLRVTPAPAGLRALAGRKGAAGAPGAGRRGDAHGPAARISGCSVGGRRAALSRAWAKPVGPAQAAPDRRRSATHVQAP